MNGGVAGRYHSVYLEFSCGTVIWETGFTEQSKTCTLAQGSIIRRELKLKMRAIKQASKARKP